MENISNIDVKREAPTNTDHLNLDIYISGLSDFIKDCPTPMTISIQGDWGTGKTSLFNLIEEQINGNKKINWNEEKINANELPNYPVISMNTWQFAAAGYQDNLTYVLLTLLCDKLQKLSQIILAEDVGANEAKKQKHENLGKSMGILATKVLASAKDPVMVLGASLLGRLIAGDAGSDSLAGFAGQFASLNAGKNDEDLQATSNIVLDIEQRKEAMQNAIKEICECSGFDRIIIFVDDLDRLEPRNAVELLEGIKNFVDCENCVFVLALDQNVVFEGVKEKYGKDLGEKIGKKFFDKIIQVPFTLPVVSYEVTDYIKNQRPNESADMIKAYSLVVSKLTDKNPRTIKRLFNMFLLYEKFEKKEDVNDVVYKVSLLALLAVQLNDMEAFGNLVKSVSVVDKNNVNKDDIDLLKEILESSENETIIIFKEVIDLLYMNSLASEEKQEEIYIIILKVLKGALGASCSVEDAIPDSIKPHIRSFREGLLTKDSVLDEKRISDKEYCYYFENRLSVKLLIVGKSFEIEIYEAARKDKIKKDKENVLPIEEKDKKNYAEQAQYFYYKEEEECLKIVKINNHYAASKLKKLGEQINDIAY